MRLTGPEIKAALGRGALTRIANQHRRSLSHVSRVADCARTGRRDLVVEEAIVRRLRSALDKPDLGRFDVFPPIESRSDAAA